jgi:1-acyl-sn-glycerol-3-phosphate acyltransferase
MNALFRFFFRLAGWKVVGDVPAEIRKAVIAVIPHNSSKDFFVGLGARATLKRKIGYLGKEELFKPPFGFIFRALGGTPVIRHKNMNLVDSYAEAIRQADDMLFALAPEGTRGNVDRLKTGFYFMALGGDIPIIPVGFDFDRKEVVMGKPFLPTGSFEKDMQEIFIPFAKQISHTSKDWIKNYENGIFK